jgi:HK97 gp10 family phage protein
MAIKGLRELNRKLKWIPKAAKEAANDNVIAAAREVAALQKSLVEEKSGDLKDSIHVTLPGQTTPPYSQPGGATTARESQAIITAGDTKVRYAHLVEFGTKAHVIKSKDGVTPMGKGGIFGTVVNHPGATAKPFFWPAWRALRKRAKRKISTGINKAIKAAATGGGT